MQLPFLFTDRHAYLAHKQVYNQLVNLAELKWGVIKDEEWHRAYSELRKELKQAEFLVHQNVPVQALLGIVVHNANVATFVQSEVTKAGLNLHVVVRPDYYYQ